MRESFDTFIVPLASMHKADGDELKALQTRKLKANIDFKIVELHEGSIRFRVEALHEAMKAKHPERSSTTRCAFLASPENFERYLDEPADFKNPLKDAFNLHMGLLAA